LNKINTIDDLAKKAFYLDDYLVEPQKGTINIGDKSHQIEPKVMDVLLHLTLNIGKVVDQETLFAQVWPKSIYSPGSIRRCITVLRKLFKDENKTLIVTHPKRGYSLQGTACFSENQTVNTIKNPKNNMAISLFFLLISLITISLFLLYSEQPSTDISISKVSPLTATQLHEDSAQYSPDGLYIAFFRSTKDNEQLNNLWLMNTKSKQEHQLTKQATNSKSLTWMQDGKALLYVLAKEQSVSINRITLDEHLQMVTEIEVLNLPQLSWLSSIAWGIQNNLYFIMKNQGKYQLVKVNLTNGEQKLLFSENNSFHPYEIALSKDSQHLAIFALNEEYNASVKLVETNKLSSETIEKTTEIVLGQNKYYGSWHPNNQSLVIHDGRELLSLSKQGKIQKIAFENYQYIRDPQFSPNGKQILLTQQVLDEDIWLTPSDNTEKAIKIVDSNTTDFYASLSPDTKKVAFVSIKRGFPQLFIYDIEKAKQTLIFDNPKQLLFISYPVWEQSSSKIASSLNQRPFIVELTGKQYKTTQLDYSKGVPIQWYSNEESLLIINYNSDKEAYTKLSIKNKQSQVLHNSFEHHILLNNNNELLEITNTAISKLNSSNNQQEIVASVHGEIIAHYRTETGIYLTVKEQDKYYLWLYNFSNNKITKVNELNKGLKIWDIEKDNKFKLISSQRSSKDLLLLTIKGND